MGKSKPPSTGKVVKGSASKEKAPSTGKAVKAKVEPKKGKHHYYYEDISSSDSENDNDLHLLEAEHHQHHHHKQEEFKVHEEDYKKSVLTYHEELAPGVERKFANKLDDAFSPCRMFMSFFFRFPLQHTVQENHSTEFTYSWKSFRGWMFFVSGGLICLSGLFIVFGLGSCMLDSPSQPSFYTTKWYVTTKPPNYQNSYIAIERNKTNQELRLEEKFLLQRNFVPMVLLLLLLAHVCTGDVTLFFRRKFIARYFTFWNEATETMKMDVATYPTNVKIFMIQVTLFFGMFLVVFVTISLAGLAPVSSGAPTQLAILLVRPFYAPIHAWRWLWIIRIVGAVIYIYILSCSKIYILLLIFKCKILTNGFATWNERLARVLHRKKKDKRSRKEESETRTGFDHLFRDYVVLLDLLRGSDTMFANVIESYYGTQVFSLCFEVFYFIRSFSAPEEFTEVRKFDGIIMAVYVFHSVVMLLLSSNAAAEVVEVGMEGLEIIRKNGCMGRKSDEEMYFTLSLYMSYTGHFETALTGGKFVTFDRSFIVSLVATIFGYFIILSQFTPPLAMLDKEMLGRFHPMELILHVETTYDLGIFNAKVGF